MGNQRRAGRHQAASQPSHQHHTTYSHTHWRLLFLVATDISYILCRSALPTLRTQHYREVHCKDRLPMLLFHLTFRFSRLFCSGSKYTGKEQKGRHRRDRRSTNTPLCKQNRKIQVAPLRGHPASLHRVWHSTPNRTPHYHSPLIHTKPTSRLKTPHCPTHESLAAFPAHSHHCKAIRQQTPKL